MAVTATGKLMERITARTPAPKPQITFVQSGPAYLRSFWIRRDGEIVGFLSVRSARDIATWSICDYLGDKVFEAGRYLGTAQSIARSYFGRSR